jgi:hypothetical protein
MTPADFAARRDAIQRAHALTGQALADLAAAAGTRDFDAHRAHLAAAEIHAAKAAAALRGGA